MSTIALIDPSPTARGASADAAERRRSAPRWVRSPLVPQSLLAQLPGVARAARAGVAVLISGERGTGKRSLARALASQADCGTCVRITPQLAHGWIEGARPRWGIGQGDTTATIALIADTLDAFPAQFQCLLADCAAEGSLAPLGIDQPVWLLATSTHDLEKLADDGRFDPALASRLSEIVLEIPPLRRRGSEIAEISRAILSDLGAALGCDLSLTAQADSALASRSWDRNLAELIGVLRRSALASEGARLDESDLIFTGRPTAATSISLAARAAPTGTTAANGLASAEPPAPVQGARVVAPAPPQLELILTELAHEMKNPMVTVKTFADNLPSLLKDPALQERFSALTDDAITRMDGLLDNILDFARMDPPEAQPIGADRLVDAALAEVQDAVARRQAHVRKDGWESAPVVLGDARQLVYALRNLLDSLLQEIPRGKEIALGLSGDGAIRIEFEGIAGVTQKLEGFLSERPGVPPPTALPLRFLLARSVVTSNHGCLRVVGTPDGATSVIVSLPLASGPGSEDERTVGKTR